jgi:cobalt/nickel transport system permease protein
MHMADGLLSPAVGATLWAVSAGTLAYSSARVRREGDERKVPLMGVLGAFVFALQMINFTIPMTGSSGHLGGGLLLAILLGPHAAFLTIASALVVQALLFADGGLLALGCNLFNLGIIPTLLIYPLVYRPLVGRTPTPGRHSAATVIAAILAVQLGALAVVLQTVASGISALPLQPFALVMLPIHLVIGSVEGMATAAIVAFVQRARPEILADAAGQPDCGATPRRTLLAAVLAAALVTGGLLSWFASAQPDGLEWSIARVTGGTALDEPAHAVHLLLAAIQERLAVLPEYAFRAGTGSHDVIAQAGADARLGSSLAGVVGGLLTLALCALLGLALRRRPGKG